MGSNPTGPTIPPSARRALSARVSRPWHTRWVLPADNHVHSQWSYDTFGRTSMVAECERALELGVPAVAFTEHLDFNDYGPGDAIATTGIKPGWWDAMRPLDESVVRGAAKSPSRTTRSIEATSFPPKGGLPVSRQ